MTRRLAAPLERYFEFEELGTNWRTEILAGMTTFMNMAYIVFVNPSILHDAGMPLAVVTAATCLSAAFGSVLMVAIARYPLALAPGLGRNAYFTYSVVKGMGVVANGAGRGVHFRREFPYPHCDRCPPAHRFGHSARTVSGGSGTLLKLLRGQYREVKWLVYALTAL